MRRPSISVVIPTYQRRDSVCRAVRSLADCNAPKPIEVIVVVDGSTDGTAHALARLDMPFTLHVLEQSNAGQAVARNRGADAAQGDLILFLDDDMIADGALIAEHVRMYEEPVDAVTGEVPLDPQSAPGLVTDILTHGASFRRDPPYSAFHLYSGNLSIRSQVFRSLGGFDQQFCQSGYGGEDLDLGIRLLNRYKAVHNPLAVAWQHNMVRPLTYMERARQLAQSDFVLMRKHPAVISDLLAMRGALPGRRTAAVGLSAVPLFARAASFLAAGAAERALSTHLRSSRVLKTFFLRARSLAYWSALRKAAGSQTLRQWLRG